MPTRRRVLMATLILCTAGCELETFDSSYPTLADAVADNQVVKGWIPAWVPQSATNLKEVHNLDSNASALAFELPQNTALALPPDCISITYQESVPTYFQRRWWPSEFELKAEYHFFRCRTDAAQYVFVGAKTDGSRALHWRTYAH